MLTIKALFIIGFILGFGTAIVLAVGAVLVFLVAIESPYFYCTFKGFIIWLACLVGGVMLFCVGLDFMNEYREVIHGYMGA